MTAVLEQSALAIPLDPSLEAHEPPEVRGCGRDDVRLLVSNGDNDVEHATFADLPRMLRAGDALVVNTSATIPAAIAGTLPGGRALRIHFSTELPGGLWLVEAREPVGATTVAFFDDLTGADVTLAGGGRVHLLDRFGDSRRLWLASPHLATDGARASGPLRRADPVPARAGQLAARAYQQIFGVEPGSAEMPSASRPFTAELVVDLARRGVTIVPILLHTGVSSLEAHEMPYPERYRVSDATAAHVNAVHRAGGRVIAAGTTVVRALETVTDPRRRASRGADGPSSSSPPSAACAVDGLAHRLARARSDAPADARSDRRAARARTGVRRSAPRRLPVARVRRQPPPAPGAWAMNDDRVAPTMPEGRRAVLYALRRRGQASADDIARQLDMTVSGAPTSERAGRRGIRGSGRAAAARGSTRPRAARVHGHRQGRRPVPEGLRRAHQRAARLRVGGRRGPHRHAVRTPPRRADPQRDHPAREVPDPEGEGRRAHAHPRRRRLPRDVRSTSSPGVFRIVEHNCAIWAVAQRYGQACSSELDFIRRAARADVERVQHMVAGARTAPTRCAPVNSPCDRCHGLDAVGSR